MLLFHISFHKYAAHAKEETPIQWMTLGSSGFPWRRCGGTVVPRRNPATFSAGCFAQPLGKPSFVNFSRAGNNKDIISILRFLSIEGRKQKNAPSGVKNEMTLGCCFLSDSRNIFVQARVISVHSWYLTSLVNLTFFRLTLPSCDAVAVWRLMML